MSFDLSGVSGIGDFAMRTEKITDKGNQADVSRTLFYKTTPAAVFLVDNGATIELRSDEKLIKLLTEKYESVMVSRYFGAGGIEIVLAGGQLSTDELHDLIRLSYNLTQ